MPPIALPPQNRREAPPVGRAVSDWWVTIFTSGLAVICTFGIVLIYLTLHLEANHHNAALEILIEIQDIAGVNRQDLHILESHAGQFDHSAYRRNLDSLSTLGAFLTTMVETSRSHAPSQSDERFTAFTLALHENIDRLRSDYIRTIALPQPAQIDAAYFGRSHLAYDELSENVRNARVDLAHLITTSRDRRALLARCFIAVWIVFILSGIINMIRRERRRRQVEKALRESETRYRELVQVLPAGLFEMSLDGTVRYANQYLLDMVGRSDEQLHSANIIELLVCREDIPRAYQHLKQMVTNHTDTSAEFRIVRPDGVPIDTILYASPIIAGGEVTSIRGIVLNISDRKRTERALRESEERFRKLSNAATEGIIIHDQGLTIDVNDAFARMLGLPREDIQGQSVFQWIAPEQHHLVREKIRTGDENSYELTIVRQDGTTFLSEVTGRLMPWHGHPVRVASVRDLTDRQAAELEITKFKAMTDTADYGCAITDIEGYFLYVNRRYADLHGYAVDDLIGRHIAVCHDLDRISNLDKVIREFISSRKRGTSEVWHRRSDGSVFPTLQTVSVIEDSGGTPLYMAGTVIDITDLKATERRLEQMAAVPENDPNLVLTIAADGRILYRNPAAAAVSFLNGPAVDRIADYLPVNIDDIISTAVSSDSGVIDIEHEAAGRIWSWSIHPVKGQAVVHCFGRDRTERKLRERRLRQLSAAVQQSASMICITDTRGLITYVNERFTTVTGYKVDEAIGQPASLLKSGRQDRIAYEDLWRTIAQGEAWTGRLQNRRKNGEMYWERKVISPIFSADGTIISYLSVGEDITAELATQQKLAESDKMSAVGMLAAGVAHEFKNYLGGIIGNASFALEELDSEEGLELARTTLQQIIETGDRANDVAMSLLSYSKARPDDFAPEDLRQIVTRSLAMVEKEMRTVSIEIVTHFDDIPRVEVSASKIQQLLLNLLINARHAIGSDGVISIIIVRTPVHVQIRVADTGVGIPEENLGRIFDPFYSTKGVWGKDELVGTGMGLAICRNIAREHSGDLTAESIVGMGTTFTLSLPLDRTRPDSGIAVTDSGSQKRVLIFTLDKEVFKRYVLAGGESSVRVLWVDSISNVGKDLGRLVDLVVCDAKFTGKVELFRMIERCGQEHVPYVMINCGVMEYQLSDLYEAARANFKQTPDLSRLLACAVGTPANAAAESSSSDPE